MMDGYGILISWVSLLVNSVYSPADSRAKYLCNIVFKYVN
jgi:hypothetical protein